MNISTELSDFIITRLGAVSEEGSVFASSNATSLLIRTTFLYTASEKVENGSDIEIHFNIGNLDSKTCVECYWVLFKCWILRST